MLVTTESLKKVDKHWAVRAVGPRMLSRAFELADLSLISSSVSKQLSLSPEPDVKAEEIFSKFAMAYEVAAIENIDTLLHPSTTDDSRANRELCAAAAWRAFEFKRLLSLPESMEERAFHVLNLAGLAYSGERWPDLRRWLSDNEELISFSNTEQTKWDKRVFHSLVDCWMRLFRKKGWVDLQAIAKIVASLRAEQAQSEAELLDSSHGKENAASALRLIALYHWAKSSELLSVYMLQGTTGAIAGELDKHFEAAIRAAGGAGDVAFEVVLRWLHVAARQMVQCSVWSVTRTVNSRVTEFIRNASKARGLFELLPPQRVAVQEQGLLDPASQAVVVELPTSGGKTLLAQFRILQALNQFDQDDGWVAYVAPTKALVSQITRTLRKDFEPFGVNVEHLSSALEIDIFEDRILNEQDKKSSFHVLVATPEKLQLVLSNKSIKRPLVLLVMDEAHNIEDSERGLRIELLLAMARREGPQTNFLLMMPFVPNGEELAKWLAPDSGRSISIGTAAWQPNERIIGLYRNDRGVKAGDWSLIFKTAISSPRTLKLKGEHKVGDNRPLGLSWSKSSSLISQTGSIASIFSERGTSVAIANTIPNVWSMARTIAHDTPPSADIHPDVRLVQNYLAQEVGEGFELIEMLKRGIAVHHAGLSDESRALIEWLAENNHLKVLCATTTLAQGINFPIASVFMSSVTHQLSKFPYNKDMSSREFWNLAGRAGRVGQGSVGVVGLAAGTNPDSKLKYLSQQTERLVSRLVTMLDEIESQGELQNLAAVVQEEQWRDFRRYVAHLLNEKENIESVINETEQLLRGTFGYSALRAESTESGRNKAQALLDVTKGYVRKLAEHPENALLADSTGFAPEGVRAALLGLNELENKLTVDDWEPKSLFGPLKDSALPNLIGVMLNVPELRNGLESITKQGLARQDIASITMSWVNGSSIQDIAEKFFSESKTENTERLTLACKAIYRTLMNSGPWGLSALSKMPTSGIDFDLISDDVKNKINLLPAFIYHGVSSEEAVLMRMNNVPRSIAQTLGEKFKSNVEAKEHSPRVARSFIRGLSEREWNESRPAGSVMSGSDYCRVWQVISGEQA